MGLKICAEDTDFLSNPEGCVCVSDHFVPGAGT